MRLYRATLFRGDWDVCLRVSHIQMWHLNTKAKEQLTDVYLIGRDEPVSLKGDHMEQLEAVCGEGKKKKP